MNATMPNVLLDCYHTVIYKPSPAVNDELFCFKCDTFRKVKELGTNWHMKCTSCRTGRYYGDDEHECRRKAVAHYNLYPDHSVSIQESPKHPAEMITSPQIVINL